MIEYTARITSTDTPRVGGRNLFRKEYFIGDLASSYKIPFDALQPRDGDNTYTLSLDYKISPEDKASSPRISCMYTKADNRIFLWDKDVKRDGDWHHKEYTIKLDIDPSKYPIYGWFTDYGSANGRTIDMVAVRNIKLERGTVATDWTPAPEDVAESVSTVNTSLVSLASTLLDPDQGEIHKLTDLLDKHKTDTDKNFEKLSNHPLTIDDNGYWQIWSVKDSKYLTTQYQSRGDKGDKGEDAGRYLGRAKRIHRDFDGNYLLEPEGSSWQTAKEGDYVYLVGDLSNRGGDKDTYYIVREHKSKTVWEVYNIKGRTAHIEWHGTSLVVDDQPPVDLRGEAGHSPSPEEVLGTSRFAELLGGEVTSQIDPVAQDLATTNSNITRASNYAIDLINETQHQLCDLQVLGMSDGGIIEVKRQATCCQYDYPGYTLGAGQPKPIPKPQYVRAQIPLTLKSTHDALSKQVSNLQVQLTSCSQRLTATKQELAKLQATTKITPVLNADTRKKGSTLYPQYGEWLLTSDSEEQYISFSGLKAELGRSIYIQTRKKAYLYSIGHSYYGLPGTSTEGNRWLSNNTTYRFVRAGATGWLVTASSSPYPWT